MGPVSDDHLLLWEAVMKGVPNTPYEGILPIDLDAATEI